MSAVGSIVSQGIGHAASDTFAGLNAIQQNRSIANARDAQLSASNKALANIQDWQKQVQGMYGGWQNMGQQAGARLMGMAMDPSYWHGYGGFRSTASQPTQRWGGFDPQQEAPQQPQAPTPGMGGGGGLPGGLPGAGRGAIAQYQDDATPMRLGPGGGARFQDAVQGEPATGGFNMQSPERMGGMQGPGPVGGAVAEDPRFAMGGLGGGLPNNSMDNIRGEENDNYRGGMRMPTGPGGGLPGVPGGGWGWNQGGMSTLPERPPAIAGITSYFDRQVPNVPAQNQGFTPTGGSLANDRGLKVAQDAAERAIAQKMAASGVGYSGGAALAGAEAAGDIANKYYNEAFGRQANIRDFNANRSDTGFGQAMGAQGQAYNQWLGGQNLNLAGNQLFGNLGLQRGQLDLANRQFGWNQTTGNREYDMALRSQQLALLSGLMGTGYGAMQDYSQLGTGLMGGVNDLYLGQGNTQAAAAMGKGQSMSNMFTTWGNNAMQAGSNMSRMFGGGK